jgi:hypothetical protein
MPRCFKLTAEDLRDIGVTRVGDRSKLLEAIAALRAGTPPSPVAEQPSEVKAPGPQHHYPRPSAGSNRQH